MKIGDSRPISGPSAVRTGAVRPAGALSAQAPVEPVRPLGDVATVAGIPTAELTPKVHAAIEMLMTEVQRLREDLRQAQQRVGYLEKLADEDSLVPIANRRAFVRELSRMVAFAERYGTPSSILYFDINGFKSINDQHGHAAGDAAIQRVAEVLTSNVRETDVVGRLGGDEFGVILAQADSRTAADKAQALAATIAANPLDWNEVALTLSVAHGTYTVTGEEKPGEALERADRAMYAQKRA